MKLLGRRVLWNARDPILDRARCLADLRADDAVGLFLGAVGVRGEQFQGLLLGGPVAGVARIGGLRATGWLERPAGGGAPLLWPD